MKWWSPDRVESLCGARFKRGEILALFVGTAGCGAACPGGVGSENDSNSAIVLAYPILSLFYAPVVSTQLCADFNDKD